VNDPSTTGSPVPPRVENDLKALAAALESRGTSTADILDGRRLRTERGRTLVIETTLAMVNAGHIPTNAEIAATCGISERTIFRYFPDREALMLAMGAEVFPRIAHCLDLDPPAGDLLSRVTALVRLRIELVVVVRQFARAVELSAPKSPIAATFLDLRRERMRSQLREWFAPELVGRQPSDVGILDMLLSYESIGQQREQFNDEELADALVAAIMTLLQRRS
jgi:AcrR family transcriptional regulator